MMFSYLQLFPTSLPQAQKKKKKDFALFYSVALLYCDRNMRSTGDERFVPECPLHSSGEPVFHLEFRSPDCEVEVIS